MTPDEKARHIVAGMMERDAFSQWLGVTVEEVAPGYARISMTVRLEMLNGHGVGHGGVTFAFADSAFAFASNGHGRVAMSIDASMHYPTSVRLGQKITAIAEEESASGPLAHYRVRVINEEETVVGLFKGTVYRTKKSHEGFA